MQSVLQVHNLKDGKLNQTIPIPVGNIIRLNGSKKNSEIFYKFVTFVTAGDIYQLDFAKSNAKPDLIKSVKFQLDGYKADEYEVKQVKNQ